jgi:hypothetical protein
MVACEKRCTLWVKFNSATPYGTKQTYKMVSSSRLRKWSKTRTYTSLRSFRRHRRLCTRLYSLLQLTVSYFGTIEQSCQVVKHRMYDQWPSLQIGVTVSSTTTQNIELTYSIMNTVLQLICGPKSLTVNSPPSSTPASFNV